MYEEPVRRQSATAIVKTLSSVNRLASTKRGKSIVFS
jgi:hypothetical protein